MLGFGNSDTSGFDLTRRTLYRPGYSGNNYSTVCEYCGPVLSLEGEPLATPFSDDTLWVWEIETGRELFAILSPSAANAITFCV